MKLAQIGFLQLGWDGKLNLLIHLARYARVEKRKRRRIDSESAQEVIKEEVEQFEEEIEIEENECQ